MAFCAWNCFTVLYMCVQKKSWCFQCACKTPKKTTIHFCTKSAFFSLSLPRLLPRLRRRTTHLLPSFSNRVKSVVNPSQNILGSITSIFRNVRLIKAPLYVNSYHISLYVQNALPDTWYSMNVYLVKMHDTVPIWFLAESGNPKHYFMATKLIGG